MIGISLEGFILGAVSIAKGISPVGGHVQSGESEIKALRREALEELGIRVKKYKYIGRAIFNRFICNRQENHFFILYEIFSDDKPLLNEESVSYKTFYPNLL